jgi:hypothetical protein
MLAQDAKLLRVVDDRIAACPSQQDFELLSNRVESLSEASGRKADLGAAASLIELTQGLFDRVNRLSARVEQIVEHQQRAEPTPQILAIERRMGALEATIDGFRSRAATERNEMLNAVLTRLDKLSDTIDGLSSPAKPLKVNVGPHSAAGSRHYLRPVVPAEAAGTRQEAGAALPFHSPPGEEASLRQLQERLRWLTKQLEEPSLERRVA